jgi:hypothetical protein
MACATVSAQIPAGWNYNPFLYYQYTAQPAPVQETAEVAAARAAHPRTHLAAHTYAGGSRVVADQPVPVWGQPATGAILDIPKVGPLKLNITVPTRPPPLPTESLRLFHLFKSSAGESLSSVQDTPEVAAARAAHLAARTPPSPVVKDPFRTHLK